MGPKKKKRQPEPEQRQPRLNRRQLLGLAAAWDAAAKETDRAVKQAGGLTPRWVKADVVYLSEEISAGELAKSLKSSRQEFFRYGLAFDAGYETALLEAELNGAKIYDYEENPGIDLEYLNTYLKKAGWPARLRGLLFPAAAVLILLFFATAVEHLGRGETAENRRQLEQALRQGCLACYAAEGVYPPDLAYLQEHYGLQVDETRYSVRYSAFAENLMPDITILENAP